MSHRAKPDAIVLSSKDNVAVAARTLPAGSTREFSGQTIAVKELVRPGHKVAIRDIAAGECIRKYGQTIGFASEAIRRGEWVHTHNCGADSFQRDYAFCRDVPPPPVPRPQRSFQGYVRPDGKVGTRNYIAIISTVNCSASTSKFIVEHFPAEELEKYPNVDGIFALTHKGGCGTEYDGADHHRTNRVLAGFAQHPNVGAYIIVGLGCEIGQASHLIQTQKLVSVEGLEERTERANNAPKVIGIQESGGIRKTIDAAVKAIIETLPAVNDIERQEVPASHLILGTQCGGSDGNSGVSANPAVGVASDLLVAQGGTAILGETPEIYGAEHLLTRRAVSREVGEKLIERIHWWERYAEMFNSAINNNPTPGNKEGGLTTIYEKSLGAVAKGGSSAMTAVYEYAEPVLAKGFVFMDTPGYDPTSLTGIIAGGANLCVFTTGRGSVYGAKPVPCLKIASNSPLYERMEDDMDINAGRVLDGVPVEEVGQEIFDTLLAVASGKKTKSETQGIGEEEFSPWIIGPIL